MKTVLYVIFTAIIAIAIIKALIYSMVASKYVFGSIDN
jgi:hypothetical protein